MAVMIRRYETLKKVGLAPSYLLLSSSGLRLEDLIFCQVGKTSWDRIERKRRFGLDSVLLSCIPHHLSPIPINVARILRPIPQRAFRSLTRNSEKPKVLYCLRIFSSIPTADDVRPLHHYHHTIRA